MLDDLVKANRLSPSFREKLLGWQHGGGFSVFGRPLILNEEPARLLHMARYAVRPPVFDGLRGLPREGRPVNALIGRRGSHPRIRRRPGPAGHPARSKDR